METLKAIFAIFLRENARDLFILTSLTDVTEHICMQNTANEEFKVC